MTNINTFQGDVFIHEYIKHTGDDNNLFGFSGTDTFKIANVAGDVFTIDTNGYAHFAKGIRLAEGSDQNILIPNYIYHVGDENTYFGFDTNDSFIVVTNGSHSIKCNSSQNVDIQNYIRHIADENTYFGFSGNDTIVMRTNGTDRLTINSSGETTVGGNLYIPSYVYHTGDTNTYFGFSSNDHYVVRTNGTDRLKIDSSGNVGIGGDDAGQKLKVHGNILATGNVTAYSDRRLKSDIVKIKDALNKIDKLNGYTYVMNDERSTGLIAQEVLEVIPEVVHGSEETTYSLAYGNMAGIIIEAIKELREKVLELENKI